MDGRMDLMIDGVEDENIWILKWMTRIDGDEGGAISILGVRCF